MAGLGFGLPLSRLYARYFGGNLRLIPLPGMWSSAQLSLAKGHGGFASPAMGFSTQVAPFAGYGCDVHITLDRTGDVLENVKL
mmetsp:Transcript_4732/g.14279  ORF Transcript_4732/g.14279 Transcript_4732/m.14279 type:complete len:83 (-) Transcript_4732:1634-1882(-)